MTEPELTPAQEDVVRRHLAAARHTDPMPGDVADRLDRVLAGLRDEPADPSAAEKTGPTEQHAPVIDLAARRRRRLTQGLVAAAFVVVAGVGVSQLAGQPGGDSSADNGVSGSAGYQEGSTRGSLTPNPANAPGTGEKLDKSLPVVRPDHFRADVLRLSRDLSSYDTAGPPKPTSPGDTVNGVALPCVTAGTGEAVISVSYRELVAALLYRRPVADSRVVELYLCGNQTPVKRTTVPATQP